MSLIVRKTFKELLLTKIRNFVGKTIDWCIAHYKLYRLTLPHNYRFTKAELQPAEIKIEIRGQEVSSAAGRILSASELNSHNTFDNPREVEPGVFKEARLSNQALSVILPAKSIVVLQVK